MAEKTVDLLAQINEEKKLQRKSRCSVGEFFDENPDYGESIQEALEDRTIYTTTIVKVLRDNGFEASDWAWKRHRRGDCACGK